MNKKLLAALETLTDHEQILMQVLAVIYAPIGQTNLQTLLKNNNCLDKTFIVDKPLRDKLQKTTLIMVNQDGWCCNPAVVQ